MERIRLFFKSVSEIYGMEDIGLLLLVDEDEKRQIAITCDKNMVYQFGLRIYGEEETKQMLPEVLIKVIEQQNTGRYEIFINELKGGQYSAILRNQDTLDEFMMRASDALLLANIANLPIFIDKGLMLRQSVEYQENAIGMSIPVNVISDDMLTKALEKAVKDENYELASHLRDELNKRNADKREKQSDNNEE